VRTRLTSTDAVPLKRMDFGEADRIITMLTPGMGKLRVLAKGVRRTTSRMSGHLEPFVHTHVLLARGRDLAVVTQASMTDPFWRLRSDVIATSHAYHLVELIDAFLEDHDAHPEVFTLLLGALQALDDGAIAPQLVARHFELHLLDAVGFRPELSICLGCNDSIQPVQNGYSAVRGGVFCPSCAGSEVSTIPISVDALKLLRYLQRTPRADQIALQSVGEAGSPAERLLRAHIEHVSERRLRAAEFVRVVAETAAGYRA